jgi:pseudomonalisin/xanthomonalisin
MLPKRFKKLRDSNIGPGMTRGIYLGIGLAALSLSATAQAAWHGTASHALSLQKATLIGDLPDTAPMRISVALKLQNQAALDSLLQSSHTLLSRDYGRTLSVEEFTAAYGPSAAQAKAVVDYLRSAGFSNIQVAANRLLVTAEGKPSLVEAAFNTRLQQFSYNNRTVHANIRDVQVPDALDGIVLSVTGLQNADVAHPLIQHAAGAKPAAVKLAGTATGHVPVQFPQVYSAGGTASGSATNIGIIASGELTQVLTDLRTYESQNGLAQVPVQFVPGITNGTSTSGLDEWDLDSQSSTSIAGTVQTLYFYNAASLNDSDLETAYNLAVMGNTAKAINVSLGGCESSAASSGDIAASDQIFEEAVAQGQTFFIASGDGGAYIGCSGQEGFGTSVSYPASSPYVVAVGGTTLDTNSDGSYAGETTWTGGGGGISTEEAAPSWQKSVTGNSSRTVPDVAMDADPNSGAEIIVSGASEQVGGTSLAAPLSTGVWARAESAHGNTLTFAAPLIYSVAASTPSAFHDVTSGCNSGSTSGENGLYTLLNELLGQKDYCAAVGFDETTGWGSFDIASFVSAL